MPTSATTYRVRLTAADERALHDLFPAGRRFDQEYLSCQFLPDRRGRVVPHKSARYEAPKEVPGDLALKWAHETLQKMGERIVPAKSITILPLKSLFAIGSPAITPEIAYLSEDNDFYYARQILHAEPKANERITEVRLRLAFPPASRLLNWAMWPTTQLESTIAAGLKVDVVLNAGLEFEIPDYPLVPGVSLGAGVRADAGGQFLLHREWRRIKARVLATGKQDDFAQWSIRKTQEFMGDVEFLILLCAPKSIRRTPIELTGWYKIRPHWFQRSVRVDMEADFNVRLPASIKGSSRLAR